jgi:hypothetical protein
VFCALKLCVAEPVDNPKEPVVLGSVSVAVTPSVGVIVVAPLVAPFNTTDPMIYP